jgi:hypothetical protein
MTALLGAYYARASAPAPLLRRDHPADEERMLALQQATLKNLDRLTEIMARNGRTREEVETQLRNSITRLEAAWKQVSKSDACTESPQYR